MIHKELSPPSRRRTVWLFLPRVLHHAARPMPAVGPIKMPASTKLILCRVMCVVEVIPQTDLFLQFGCSPNSVGLFFCEIEGKQTKVRGNEGICVWLPKLWFMQCGKIFRYRFHSRQWCFVGKSKRAEGGGFRVVTDYTPPSEPISRFWKHDGFLKGGLNISRSVFISRLTDSKTSSKAISRSRVIVGTEGRAFVLWFVFR